MLYIHLLATLFIIMWLFCIKKIKIYAKGNTTYIVKFDLNEEEINKVYNEYKTVKIINKDKLKANFPTNEFKVSYKRLY